MIYPYIQAKTVNVNFLSDYQLFNLSAYTKTYEVALLGSEIYYYHLISMVFDAKSKSR